MLYTIILVKDPSGGYTAFFKEFPNVISDGDNEEQAITNLRRLIGDFLVHNSKISIYDSVK